MEIVIIIAVNSIANILCFLFGAKIGQKTAKGENIELPKIPNPKEAIDRYKDKKEQEQERERNAIIMENIDNYDGTPIGQKDVPR